MVTNVVLKYIDTEQQISDVVESEFFSFIDACQKAVND